MTTVERTRQQLDPAGSIGTARITIALVIGAYTYALVMTARGEAHHTHPTFAVLAHVFLAIAGATAIFASRPSRAPFTARSHAVVHAAALLAVVCEAIGQWGADDYVRDNWGPVALGILLASLGPYRPVKEIVGGGIFSAVVIGVIAFSQVPSLVTRAPSLDFVVVAVIPVFAPVLATVIFSGGIVCSIERWQKRAQARPGGLASEVRESITRSVHQDQVTILNREVLPFFRAVLERGTITNADRDRARMIANSIRQVMVEEIDRSWLESLLERMGMARTNRAGAARVVVVDPQHVASAMTVAQRTAIRALLVAFADTPGFDRCHLRIVLADVGDHNEGVITAQVQLGARELRSSFAPFFAVMRAAFTDLKVNFVHSEITLRFLYDHD